MSGKNAKKQKLSSGGDAERLTKQCASVLKAMQKNPNAVDFLQPVDWKALKLNLYPKMIKHPMDLGTVEQKLNAGRYATTEDFAKDVDQIWENAHIFNQEGSQIYDTATLLRDIFREKMKDVESGPLHEGASSSGMTAEELVQCKAIVRDLRKNKDAQDFLEPVNWKSLGLMDYPNIIKRPMDIGTVSKRLDAGQYASVHSLYADIDLIWTNAMTYNKDESTIYILAHDLKQYTDKKFGPLLSAARGGKDEPTELTFEMKRQLNENSISLNSKDLYGMVGIVEESCKRAIDQSNPSEVEIDIDSLDLQTFLKLNKYVEECIKRQSKKGKQQ
ncbi:hypothetical protein AB1Y20_006605 [Prymnesium parvum]|uniref:Bromo domain-containing protein n=1 Tax=Prymnesium parvum TaxID=97485 RepID=A0AB34J0A4_PRYPA